MQNVFPENPVDVLVSLDQSVVAAHFELLGLQADKAELRQKLIEVRKSIIATVTKVQNIKDSIVLANRLIREKKNIICRQIGDAINANNQKDQNS